MGRGVTEAEIRIGFEYAEGVTTLFESFGYDSGGPPPDERATIEAIVRWVNANGGIAGRQVVPVLQGTNPVNGTIAQQAAATCARWTEDGQVFAAGSMPLAGSADLAACMAQRQTPFVAQTSYPFGERHTRQWASWLYMPGKVAAERAWNATVDGLAERGWFSDATIGIMAYDEAHFRYLTDQVVEPRINRHGFEVAEKVRVSFISGAADAGRLASETNNAILRFRSAGVTHVLFVDYEGSIGFFFMPAAHRQGYRPAYGLNSFNNLTILSKQAPDGHLDDRTMAVGWLPSGDTHRQHYPTDNTNANQCQQIVSEAGLDQGYSTPAFWTHPHCDTVMFLKHALERAPELTPAGLRHAVERMGTDYLSPQSLASRFGPGRIDGADAYRFARYDDGCGCFVYQGANQRIP
jgi:ABC-type branched-subunit amino acid transport system substrate-binding protein